MAANANEAEKLTLSERAAKFMKAKAGAHYGEGFGPYPDGKENALKCGMGICGVTAVPKEADYIHRLESDLANSYYWTGNCMKDYLYFVAQWHPIFGMFLSHPNHPWAKCERVLMYVIALSVSTLPGLVVAQYDPAHANKIAICMITIPNTILGVVLYQLAIAETHCPNSCIFRPCIEICKNCLFCFSLCFGTFMTCACVVILRMNGACHSDDTVCLEKAYKAGVWVFVMGQVYSWVLWFPLYALMPCQVGFFSLWCYEKGEANKNAADGDLQEGLIPEAP